VKATGWNGDGQCDVGSWRDVTLVAAGLGVAIVPAPTAALDIAGVRYLPLMPATLGVDLVAAHAAVSDSPLIANVLDVLRAQATQTSE